MIRDDCEAPAALPYSHLNLRRNPFGELDLKERAELALVDVARYVQRLNRPGYAVQFLGDKGRGKTTHLLAIGRNFPAAAYVHIGENERPRIPRGCPLLIDEVQRLPSWRRWRVFRRPVSFVLGSHEDFSAELRRANVDVETVQAAGQLDAERLVAILNRRIAFARRAAGPIPQIQRKTAAALMARFGSDVRAIEWRLYDLFQNLEMVRDV